MKTPEQIKTAVERLKVNKSKCKPQTYFGDDTHAAIDAQIETLERGYTEGEVYDNFEDEDFVCSAAISILEWKDGDDDSLEDYLYPETE